MTLKKQKPYRTEHHQKVQFPKTTAILIAARAFRTRYLVLGPKDSCVQYGFPYATTKSCLRVNGWPSWNRYTRFIQPPWPAYPPCGRQYRSWSAGRLKFLLTVD